MQVVRSGLFLITANPGPADTVRSLTFLTIMTTGEVVLVTGGSGLVGKAIECIINSEPEGSRYGKKPGETWIFASSKDGDLKSSLSVHELSHHGHWH